MLSGRCGAIVVEPFNPCGFAVTVRLIILMVGLCVWLSGVFLPHGGVSLALLAFSLFCYLESGVRFPFPSDHSFSHWLMLSCAEGFCTVMSSELHYRDQCDNLGLSVFCRRDGQTRSLLFQSPSTCSTADLFYCGLLQVWLAVEFSMAVNRDFGLCIWDSIPQL